MSYNPIKYWTKRKNPNKYDSVREDEERTLKPLIEDADSILDYGIGTGRLMPLYKGKAVLGVDIVETYKQECIKRAKDFDVDLTWSKEVIVMHDLGVLSKVLLHEENPKNIIYKVANRCDKVYISTGVNLDSHHCFNHDYKELLADYDILLYELNGNDLTIVFQ